MGRIVVLLASLIVGSALVWLGQRLPAPLPADAPPAVFSAERAMNDVRAIAQRPHPIGSADNARVRAYLLTRGAQLGVTVETQRGVAVQGQGFGEGDRVLGVGVPQNVLMRMVGRDPAAPPLLLMAHYDSVPGSAGAADDAIGASSLLEVARAMRTGGAPARDVYFLFTDGEEAGLYGARLFFARHPLARRLGAVVNLEARGSSGQAVMFETGPRNGAMIDLYGAAVGRPAANSLTGFVYRNLPNDTDFTLARTAGLPGFNIAPIGDQQDYHSPSATPANLSPETLQHMGDQALALARGLSGATVPPRADNAVYFDVFGLALARYPAWGGWLVVAAAAVAWVTGTLRARRLGQGSLGAVGWGLVGFLLTTVLAVVALKGARMLIPGDTTLTGLRPILVQFHLYEVGAALVVGGAVLLTAAVLTRRSRSFAGVASGLTLGLLLIAVVSQAMAPEAAFFFGWPALAAALGLFAWASGEPRPRQARALLAFAASVFVFGAVALFGHLLLVSLGAETPAALAVLAPMSLTLLAPALLPVGAIRGALWAGVAVLVAGVAVFGVVSVRHAYNARSPEVGQVVYVAEPAAGRAALVSALDPLDPLSRSALGRNARRAPAPDLFARQAWSAPARPVSTTPVAIQRSDDRGAVLGFAAPGSRELRVTLTTAADLAGAVVGDQAVEAQGRTLRLRYSGAGPLTVRLPGMASAQVHGTVAAVTEGWPAGAPALPPRSPASAPWGQSDSTITVARF